MRSQRTIEGRKIYKVTSRSSGGITESTRNFRYTLPKNGHPGKWMTISKRKQLRMCREGFHVTTDPRWWSRDGNEAKVYEVEVKGLKKVRYPRWINNKRTTREGYERGAGSKYVCRAMRLLRLVPRDEVPDE